MLLGAQRATLLRVDTPEWAVVAAAWSDGTAPPVPVGHRGALDGRGIAGGFVDPRPVRIEDFDEAGGSPIVRNVVAELMRELRIRRGAGGPIILGGRVWGAVTAVWPADVAMPPGAGCSLRRARVVCNRERRPEIASGRRRPWADGDATRRCYERSSS